LRYLDDEGGLVSFAPASLGREEGGVGLCQDAVEGELAGYVAQVLGLRVGHVAGEGNEEAHVQAAPGLLERARKAMEDSGQARASPCVVQDREAIVPGVAAMNDHGLLRGARQRELPAKDSLLHVARGMVVVIIEAHFAPSDHAGVAGQFFEAREMRVRGLGGVVGMNADAGVNPVVLLGEGDGGVEAFGGAGAAADGQQRGDAGGAGTFEHGRAVFIEVVEFEVRV